MKCEKENGSESIKNMDVEKIDIREKGVRGNKEKDGRCYRRKGREKNQTKYKLNKNCNAKRRKITECKK